MAKVHRIDFYPDEWIAGTVPLTLAERGLYITACALMYSHGGPIEVDHLKGACRDHGHTFNATFKRLLDLGKLSLKGALVTNKRVSNELQNALKRISNSRQNGAQHKKNNELENPLGVTINYQLSDREKEKEGLPLRGRCARAREAPPDLEISHGGKGTRLAADWQPDPQDRFYAEQRGLDPDTLAEQFRDYWCTDAGPKSIKRDWHAAWRTWVRREPAYASQPSLGGGRPKGNRQRGASFLEIAARTAARLTDR